MHESDFEYISSLVERESGIVLSREKMYLIESRLAEVLKSEGIESISDLVLRLRWQAHNSLHDRVVDVMTTNETFFFRDDPPFEALRKHVIKELMRKRMNKKKLKIWSAACSSGQEPYSIAILLHEHFPALIDWEIQIYATDIAENVLRKAKKGVYTPFELSRGLPESLVGRYFEPVGNNWQIKRSIRETIRYEKLNLMHEVTHLPMMDIIFLRNVLIYFKRDIKNEVLARIQKVLKPDGYLFLGQSETATTLVDIFEPRNLCAARCFQNKGVAMVNE